MTDFKTLEKLIKMQDQIIETTSALDKFLKLIITNDEFMRMKLDELTKRIAELEQKGN